MPPSSPYPVTPKPPTPSVSSRCRRTCWARRTPTGACAGSTRRGSARWAGRPGAVLAPVRRLPAPRRSRQDDRLRGAARAHADRREPADRGAGAPPRRHYRWLRISAAVADGPEPLVYLSGTDVTDLHEALEQLAGERTRSVRRTAELERSNAELERFASVVSHDLRQSLTAVSGFLALLESRHGAALAPDAAELLALAREGGERMHALVEDLLAYARVGHSGRAPERVDATELVRRLAPTAAGAAHARARRAARRPRAPARVRAAAGEPDRQRGQVRARRRAAGRARLGGPRRRRLALRGRRQRHRHPGSARAADLRHVRPLARRRAVSGHRHRPRDRPESRRGAPAAGSGCTPRDGGGSVFCFTWPAVT